jgi:hypothetical protein
MKTKKKQIHSGSYRLCNQVGRTKALKNNIAIVTAKFLYEYILTRFGCPLTIAINQGVHFIDDIIKHLTKHFLLKHVSSTTYYPQGNGQAKSTNKNRTTYKVDNIRQLTRWQQNKHLTNC